MSDRDFYADPTVFDALATQSRDWLCHNLGRLCPYGWTLGFAVFAFVFAGLGAALLVDALSVATGGEVAAWNESLARTAAVVAALLAGRHFLRLALNSWPVEIAIPAQMRRLARVVGWHPPLAKPGKAAPRFIERRRTTPQQRERIQEFFSDVRAAGVNVTIARALFNAGIRSSQQLAAARDEQLHGIHGVGPATVRKLRAHFNQHPPVRGSTPA